MTKQRAIETAYHMIWDARHQLEGLFKKDDATMLPNGDKLVYAYDSLNGIVEMLEQFM